MTVKAFNEKYGDKGGVIKLTEMRAKLETQDSIANQFGVTKERVRQFMQDFFGEEYDPRHQRKTDMIHSMLDFSKFREKDEFRDAYKSSEYYKEALELTAYDS